MIQSVPEKKTFTFLAPSLVIAQIMHKIITYLETIIC